MADKKLKDLDDVEKVLKQNTADEISERRARRKTEMERKRAREAELLEYGRILMIPAIVIVLMIIIVVADGSRGNNAQSAAPTSGTESQTEQDSSAGGETETQETDETETTEDPTIVRAYNDNTLEDFFAAYFQARLDADTDKLYQMTGVTSYTDEQTQALRTQLKTQAGYIEGYDNIRLYAVNALEQYSKLVFITYDVKFRRVETAAPGIMYCYIRVTDQNSYQIVENMSPEQTRFVNEYVTGHEEVRELIDSADSKLLQAISTDQRLAVVYDAFMTGRIYQEDQSVIDSEVSLIEIKRDDEDGAEAESSEDGSAGQNVSIEETGAADGAESAAESEAGGGAAGAEGTSAGGESSATEPDSEVETSGSEGGESAAASGEETTGGEAA